MNYHSILANASGHFDWSLKTRAVTMSMSGISFSSRHSQQLHARAHFICTCRNYPHLHYCKQICLPQCHFQWDDDSMLRQECASLPLVWQCVFNDWLVDSYLSYLRNWGNKIFPVVWEDLWGAWLIKPLYFWPVHNNDQQWVWLPLTFWQQTLPWWSLLAHDQDVFGHRSMRG